MKKRTKIFAVTRLLFSATALFVLAACAPVTGPEVSDLPPGKGLVNISLGIDGDPGPARTLAPGSVKDSAFSSYKLVFTPAEGAPVTLEDQTGLTGIALSPGTYTLNLTAYAGLGEGKKEAAAGTVTGIVVSAGNTAPVSVSLVFKPGAGDGTLHFTVTRPSTPSNFALTGAEFALTLLPGGSPVTTTGWLEALYAGEKKTSHTADKTLASGYYLATVTLSTPDQKAVRTDIVHIGAGHTTTLNWAFVENDFSTTFTKVWLVGVMNSWTLPGTLMTQAANGTFTWEGEIGTGDLAFKFSLTDTINPTPWTDTWNGNWFAPSITQTANTRETVNVGNNIPMVFAPTNTSEGIHSATESAWKMNAAGYYRLTVNPPARTFNIEALAFVTGVTITGGDVSLNKGGSKTFAAVVNGHNSPSQEVAWSIASTHVPGTAFNGNILTIDAGETAATLTIRATSTANSDKYGEITVTVLNSTSPAVTDITVSAADNVTEVQRNTTLQFNAAVDVINGATTNVTWTVSGKDKDGNNLGSITSTISPSGILTVDANEAAVDLVVRATSTQEGFTNIYEEASVFVRKLGNVYLIGDEFGNWTDTGTVQLAYANRGVYTTTELMSKDKYFRFRDGSSGAQNHFEPYPDHQEPTGTKDAWQHLSSDTAHTRTTWKTTQGGSYAISLDTVTEKVTFTRTAITGITVEVTYGRPMTAVTKIDNVVAPKASVTWTVEKSGAGGDPYSKTTINQDGWLTVDNYEPDTKEMIIRATSNYDETVSGICTFTISKYPNVWLIGNMQGWTLLGTPMERSQNGQTFTWQGDISNGDFFRFNRSDFDKGTTNWKRDWLGITWNNDYPRQIDTGSSGEECNVAAWTDEEPSGNKANWQFSGSTGTYKIILDVSAMTIRIEAVL